MFCFVSDDVTTTTTTTFKTRVDIFGCNFLVSFERSDETGCTIVLVTLEGFTLPPRHIDFISDPDFVPTTSFVDDMFTDAVYSDRLRDAIKDLADRAIDNYVFGVEF